MTDEQIIKALECCITNQHKNCCNLGKWSEQWNCMTDLMGKAIAIIKRQREEIAGLRKHIAELRTNFALKTKWDEICAKQMIIDQIREFAERLKGCIFERDDELIDEIARQMTEEQK